MQIFSIYINKYENFIYVNFIFKKCYTNFGIYIFFFFYEDDLRVCSYCCKTVLSCVKSLDSSSRIDEDLHSLHPNQPVGFSIDAPAGIAVSSKQNASTTMRRKSSVIGFREEDIAKAK